MPKIAMLNQEGAKVGEIELSEAIFASEINESVLHLVVRSQLAAKRQGTQSAKTRGEVRGGGRKIYRQKGTGNARHHGNRAPQFTHGGVVFAPKPRDYVVNVPKKVRRLALKGALTSKVNDGEMIVLDKIALILAIIGGPDRAEDPRGCCDPQEPGRRKDRAARAGRPGRHHHPRVREHRGPEDRLCQHD